MTLEMDRKSEQKLKQMDVDVTFELNDRNIGDFTFETFKFLE